MDPTAVVRSWLEQLSAATERADAASAQTLFLPDAWWRDLLAFTWDLRTFHGREAIAAALNATLADTGATRFRLEPGKNVVLTDGDDAARWIQAFFLFETHLARGRGFLRLKCADSGEWLAWTLLTAMDELKGFEERVGPRRTMGTSHGERTGRRNWLEERVDEREFVGCEPQVVVVGAGQAGLTIAARLKQLGVATLVVEKNGRVGDNWRSRYRSLVLHDPVWYDHLPYLPFPAHWPVFTPKDKLAGWLESYVEALELDVWTNTACLAGEYDEKSQRWTLRLARPGGDRVLHPRHVVLATGMSGVPNVPQIPGAETFGGRICHSSAHTGSEGYAGKHAVVVGCCNSGHDIAQDFCEHGAGVTMVQRSSTYVMSSENGIKVLFAGVYEEGGPPVEDADLIFASIPYPLLAVMHREATKTIAELDREMLDGLERAGFKLDYGDDDSGIFLKYLRRGGGYYIDVGCSRLIAEGRISIKQGVQIERFSPREVVFTDGSTMPADIVVFATGFKNMRESARALVGDKVADRLGDVWGLDGEGEIRTMWRRSGHRGFWFMGGNLHQCRHYSKVLALQIKAIEEDLLDPVTGRSRQPASSHV